MEHSYTNSSPETRRPFRQQRRRFVGPIPAAEARARDDNQRSVVIAVRLRSRRARTAPRTRPAERPQACHPSCPTLPHPRRLSRLPGRQAAAGTSPSSPPEFEAGAPASWPQHGGRRDCSDRSQSVVFKRLNGHSGASAHRANGTASSGGRTAWSVDSGRVVGSQRTGCIRRAGSVASLGTAARSAAWVDRVS